VHDRLFFLLSDWQYDGKLGHPKNETINPQAPILFARCQDDWLKPHDRSWWRKLIVFVPLQRMPRPPALVPIVQPIKLTPDAHRLTWQTIVVAGLRHYWNWVLAASQLDEFSINPLKSHVAAVEVLAGFPVLVRDGF